MIGKTEDVSFLGHNSALFLYLLSYEFPETVLIIDKIVTFITSPKKAKILQQLENVKVVLRDNENEIKKILENKTFSMCDSKQLQGTFCQKLISLFTPNDITNDVSKFFTVKDACVIDNIDNCYKATKILYDKGKKYLLRFIEDDILITHKQLSNKIENLIDNIETININNLDLIYPPLIQSFNYDPNDYEVDDLNLHQKVFYRIGLRYNGYCSEIGRTIMVNPSEKKMKIYESLFVIRESIFERINKSINSIDLKDINNYVKELSIKHEVDLHKWPVIFSSGLLQDEGIVLEKSENYAFCIDLQVNTEETFLNLCDSFYVKGNKIQMLQDLDACKDFVIQKKSSLKKESRFKVKEIEKNISRLEHQRELMDNLMEEMAEYYKKGEYKTLDKVKENTVYIPYQKENLLPRYKTLFIDKKNYAICVPFESYVIPFSITAIKNVSKTEDGVLRINFNASNDDFLKSILYKNKQDLVDDYFTKITELKKEFNLKKEFVTNKSDDDKLITTGRKFILPEVFVKTDVKARKGKANSLEMHENGFRYNYENQNIEILFSNIKHMFFCEGTIEHRVLIHFNLYQPVYIPKKSYNIQFYKESGTNTVQDTSKIKDEYYEAAIEKEEENKRREINNEFSLFVDKIESHSKLRVQLPTKAGAFYGVPHKGSVYIQPTSECIVNLIEAPFFVLTLSEVEIVCFERVMYGVKTCDMTFIFKNKETPVCTVQSIDALQLHKVKEFLDDKNICFVELRVNIQWSNFIKVILQDPVHFYNSGGWNELQPSNDAEESETTEEDESEISSSSSSSSDLSSNSDDEDDESTKSSGSNVDSEDDESIESEDDDEYVESEETPPPKRKKTKK
ncbi:FACT complex subunit spt16 [Binucleata daphniae]